MYLLAFLLIENALRLQGVFSMIVEKTIVYGVDCRNPKGMEVMLMKKYDFKDLMAFGVFIIALLTSVFSFR